MGSLCMVAVLVCASLGVYALIPSLELNDSPTARIVIESATLKPYQEVMLLHTGGEAFDVSGIRIDIYVNGVKAPHSLDNLPSGIGTTGFLGPPSGVLHNKTGCMAGQPHDSRWDVGDTGGFKIAKGTNVELHEGDLLEIWVVHKTTGVPISVAKWRV